MKANEAIGAYLKDFRAKHGLTLDAIADAANRYGAKWAASTVSDMEHGGRKVDAIPNLLLLAAVLNDLLSMRGEAADISIYDMIGQQDLSVTPSFDVPADDLAGMVGVQPVRFDIDDGEEFADGISIASHIPISAAEKRAAKKLGMTPKEFHESFLVFSSQTLDEAVAQRVGPNASPQKRGSVTRELLNDMLEHLAYVTYEMNGGA